MEDKVRFTGNFKNASPEFEGNKWQTAKMRPPRPVNEVKKKRYSAYDVVLHPGDGQPYITTKDGKYRTLPIASYGKSRWSSAEGLLGTETDTCVACFSGIDDTCKLLNKLLA
jgi:hypothetical protein